MGKILYTTYYIVEYMPETHSLKIDSIVRPHTTNIGTMGLIESKILATVIGKRIVEIKYTEK